jgi:Right handed beta helix region
MIRIIAKVFAVAVSTKLAAIGLGAALSAVLLVLPAQAQRTYVANGGSNNGGCTFSTPCSSMTTAIFETQSGGTLSCLSDGDYGAAVNITVTMTIDCVGTTANVGPFTINGTGITVTIKNVTIYNRNAPSISFNNGARLYLDNVTIDSDTNGLTVQTAEPSMVVVSNSTFKNNTAAGVLIKPSSGGSVTATFDGVTIVNNAGGLKTDSTNGAVRIDISNSTISNNADNGLIAIGGAGGQNMVTLKSDVIASNGQAGIEASGASAAVLVNNAVLDSNTGGALQAVSSGRILTYQNNTVIGTLGTGFSGTAAPQ